MRKLFLSLAVIGITSAIAIGATSAYFSDTETSSANTFTAGTLDLKLNGGDQDVSVTFGGMNPVHSQPNFGYVLKNAGTIAGKLTINNISVTDAENGILEPEAAAGDVTDSVGELSSVLNIRIWVDINSDGYISAGEPMLYNGLMKNLPSSLDTGVTLNGGNQTRIAAVVDWWATANDNLAQSDSSVLDMTFTLTQI
jgi:predicted ribosomally synthesized peptide with SipW-like signal peptide